MGSTLQPEERNTCRWVAFTFTKRLKPRVASGPVAQSIGAGLEPKRQRRPNRLVMHADTTVGPAASEQVRRHGDEIPARPSMSRDDSGTVARSSPSPVRLTRKRWTYTGACRATCAVCLKRWACGGGRAM